jgi:quercetin 2,3-dioxygenase
MKTVFHTAASRGQMQFDWLNARYSFSFAQYHDPARMHFGALRVLNDDIISGGGGFPTHAHDNMEIVTIPLSGSLQHRDSTGNEGVIEAGDVQIMSAGSGIRHSEFNASATESLNLFQVWLFPKERNITPRYDQRFFEATARKDTWQVLVSPDAADGGLWINQDARFLRTDLSAGKALGYAMFRAGNGAYLMVIDGQLAVGETVLNSRDAIGIWETDGFELRANEDTRVLLIDVPMQLN